MTNACADLGALEDGRLVYEQLVQSGCESNVFVGCSLIDMYAKCGSIEEAQRMFNKMPSRYVVTWNAMIFGHVVYGQGHTGHWNYFNKCNQRMCHQTSVTFVGVLNACASVGVLKEGRCAHD